MIRRTWTRLASLAGATALVAIMGSAALAAPSTISYVGELYAKNGLPYSGMVQVSAALYDAGSGGNEIRPAEDLGMVQAWNGALRFDIGAAGDPIDAVLLNNENLWLEVTVDGVTLDGRQRLQSAPYALQAADSKHLGSTPADDYVTATELGSNVAAASSSGTAPTSPSPGTLWWDEPNDNLYIWDSGASDWIAVSAAEIKPENLPANGLGAMSNGMLTNEFEGVTYQWTAGADIQDATLAGDGQPAQATVNVVEGSQSYLYAIQVETNFSLTSSNNVQMRLFPPAGTTIGPITLLSGTLTFGPYGNIWTTANTPALADLLGKNPAGTWTLAVVDKDNNLSDAGANSAGALNSFTVTYNVVRSDNLAANGTIFVDDLKVNGTITGQLSTNGAVFAGNLDVAGTRIRKLQYQVFNETQPNTGGILPGRNMQFTKKYDDSWIRVEWNDNTYTQSTSNRQYQIRVNGNNCSAPHPMEWRQRSNGWYERSMRHFIAYCQQVSGIAPVPGVNGGVNIPAGTYTIGIYQNASDMQVGWNNSMASITVEEVYKQ